MKQLVDLIVLGAFFVGLFMWEFWYPQHVTRKAYESVKLGQNLFDLVKEESAFLEGMGRTKYLIFEIPMDEGLGFKKSCASILFHGGEALLFIGDMLKKENLVWRGSHEHLINKLADYKEDLNQCSHLSATYMPAGLTTGTNKIQYDQVAGA